MFDTHQLDLLPELVGLRSHDVVVSVLPNRPCQKLFQWVISTLNPSTIIVAVDCWGETHSALNVTILTMKVLWKILLLSWASVCFAVSPSQSEKSQSLIPRSFIPSSTTSSRTTLSLLRGGGDNFFNSPIYELNPNYATCKWCIIIDDINDNHQNKELATTRWSWCMDWNSNVRQ